MLLEAIGQLLGMAKSVKESHCEISKGYWIAFG
jgi:hypothetical protein